MGASFGTDPVAIEQQLGHRAAMSDGKKADRKLNVAVIGLSARHWETYFPSFGEVGITLGITAAALFAFGWLARILPIHEELPAPATRRHPEAQASGVLRSAEGAS
jgi:hypothetical protein